MGMSLDQAQKSRIKFTKSPRAALAALNKLTNK